MPPAEAAASIVQRESQDRQLVLISGFIHDIGPFMEKHPGGRVLLEAHVGKDATSAFFGGVYDHSNAAHNVRELFRSFICLDDYG